MKKCVRRGESIPGPLDYQDLTYLEQKDPNALTVTPQRVSFVEIKIAQPLSFFFRYLQATI